MEEIKLFCMNCGQELPEMAKFCFVCGNKVEVMGEIEKEIIQGTMLDENIEVNTLSDIDNNIVLIDESNNSVNVFGKMLLGKDPTTIYVEAVEMIINKFPKIIGQKETHFTTDKDKADTYTGKNRELFINGYVVYVKTGFSTQAKWKNIKAICKLVGITCDMVRGESKENKDESVEKQKNISNICNNELNKKTQNIHELKMKQSNITNIIDKMQFKGMFDSKAAFSRCYIECNGSGYDKYNSVSYVEYNNHIYFLVYKDEMEDVNPKKLSFNYIEAREMLDIACDELIDVEPGKRDQILDKIGKIWDEIIEGNYPKSSISEEYKNVLVNTLSDLRNKIHNLAKNILLEKYNANIFKDLEDYTSDNVLNNSYKLAFAEKKKKVQYSYVVFGAIDLATSRVEILKEYQSNYWKGGKLGDVKRGSAISVSNNKIWYITYENDDMEAFGNEHGNLAVKCLDITTKTESVVMKLPKVTQADMAVVIGNIFTYKADNKMVIHNLVTGKVHKKSCKYILGYNDSYIIFMEDKNYMSTNYILDTSSGEVKEVKKYIKENLKIEDNFEEIYYIDCKNKCIYAKINGKIKDEWGTWPKCYKAIIYMNERKVEIIDSTATTEAYKFLTHFDGRFYNVAFDGSLYIMRNKGSHSAEYTADKNEPYDYALVRIDKDGSKHWSKCDSFLDDRNILVPLGNDNVIAKLSSGKISLYHNNNWYEIFNVSNQ